MFVPSIVVAGPARAGAQIYRQRCDSCHGPSGEGTDDHYPRPLIGERSVAGLAKLIAKTMPEDAPGDCVGEDADKVAAYIYESFYSKTAQAHNKFRFPGSSFALPSASTATLSPIWSEASRARPTGMTSAAQG